MQDAVVKRTRELETMAPFKLKATAKRVGVPPVGFGEKPRTNVF